MSEENSVTIKQASEMKNIPIPTLKLLCRQGRIPGAHLVDTPFGKGYWLIPVSSLDKIVLKKGGRPPKSKYK